MYQTALHLPWHCGISTTAHSEITRNNNTPVFIRNCPVLPMDQITPQTLCAIPTNNRSLVFAHTVGVTNSSLRIETNNCQNPKQKYQHSPVLFPNHPAMPVHVQTNNISSKVHQNNEQAGPSFTASNILVQSDSTLSKPQSGRGLKRQHEKNSNHSPSQSRTNSPEYHSKRRYSSSEDLQHKNEKKTVETVTAKIPQKHNQSNKSASFEPLSNSIWTFVIENKQTEQMFAKKIKLRDVLYNEILKKLYPMSGLYIVGSSLTGLGFNNSDLDLCMMLTHDEIDQETEATDILKTIFKSVSECSFFSHVQLIHAKVPILKFFDRVSGVDVDLNVNNSSGIRNTQLLNSYNRLDWRFSVLSMLVKLWARQHNINDARTMTLTSYSLVLMVIHFLQTCSPPVLPCLQKVMRDKFDPNSDVRQLILREELPPFKSENKKMLGELLLDFFNYYGNEFDFSKNVISIRTGGILPKDVAMNCKSPKNKRGQWKFVCIEEPMNRTNTSHSVYNERAYNRILQVFRTSYKKLLDSNKLQSVLRVHDAFN